MSKTNGHKENFRVVVYPRGMGDFGSVSCGVGLLYNLRDPVDRQRLENDQQARCDEIAADIKRHVDNVASVYVEFDHDDVCEHCGWKWTEAGDQYNGGCCHADQEAEEARLSAEQKEPT